MKNTKKAILLANATSFVLMSIKLFIWITSWSLAVLSSAMDSLMDFFVSLFNFFVLKKTEKWSCKNYNYGQWKIQWIWAILEWWIVLFSGIILIILSGKKLLNKLSWENLDLEAGLFVMWISIFFTALLVWYLDRVSKKTNDLTVKSDALHYKTDLYTNLWIILSLITIKITWFYFIDPIISILIWIYIIYSSKEIIWEWYQMIMDRKIDDDQIKIIENILENTDKQITGYHLLKTRKSGHNIFIDFHLVFDEDIKLIDAHNIADIVEKKILEKINNAKIMIHLEPYDNSSDEK